MNQRAVLAGALCLSLLTTSAFAVDEHEKDYLDKQVQLVVDNLQKISMAKALW